jgi:hypothetical protein
VPLKPLLVTAHTTRPGKKVQFVSASMVADGVEVARATALRVRAEALDLPRVETTATMGDPGAAEPFELDVQFTREGAGVGFWSAMDVRLLRGSWMESGPAAVWFRLRFPIVGGEETSPLQRVAAAGDFGNGISASLGGGRAGVELAPRRARGHRALAPGVARRPPVMGACDRAVVTASLRAARVWA